ncbi:hypothetical protein EK21DRAFT_115895 [Setomelanomma holmii]|uniref:Fungal N-terminal domain-containing protein n=1 Tax=Setomelanomma holmii TaxID=210430 RepID=A0A9P4H450_9PLEO|nr:hypothetical protein EK21DRAFT_115895 [Setomelanomma holmii]
MAAPIAVLPNNINMVLEVVAAFVGLIAAASKVVEIVGPMVSAYREIDSLIASVNTEVTQISIFLPGLKKLFDNFGKTNGKQRELIKVEHFLATLTEGILLFDEPQKMTRQISTEAALEGYLKNLSTSPRVRKDLIQVDQLIPTLTEGVLLFSELEALTTRLVNNQPGPLSRMKWAWNDEKFTVLVGRIQNFKSSMNLMLSILQCQSDMEALRSHRRLLAITSSLLENDRNLARRMSYLEDCFDTAHTIRTNRPGSFTTGWTQMNDKADSLMQDTNDTLARTPYDSSVNLPFERILLSSRVYHKAKAQTCDVSFRSSIGISHAWTALSDISLSNISDMSVIALPLLQNDVSNWQQYAFASSFAAADVAAVSEAAARVLSHITIASNMMEDRRKSFEDQPAAPHQAPVITKFAILGETLVVKGSLWIDPNSFVEKFATRQYPQKDNAALEAITLYRKGTVINGAFIVLPIQVINDSALPRGVTRGQMYRGQSMNATMFMLFYMSASQESLEHIERYVQEVPY